MFYAILIVCLSLPFCSNAQEIKEHPSVFSLRNSKFSIGVGLEGSYPSFMGNTTTPSDLNVKYKDTRKGDDSYPYLSASLVFDLYSDNSLLGLLFGANYSILTTTYQKENTSIDYFNINSVEFPLYLKIRPGYVNSKNHVWILLGAIYSLPVTAQREYNVITPRFAKDVSYVDQDISQEIATLSASASFGYEGYLTSSKSTRGAVFITGSYPLSNQFNANYAEFVPGGRSVFSNYPGFDVRDIRISIGIKYLYKLSKSKL